VRLVDDDYWWQRRAGENLWMEITRRDDIGADLKAPAAARGGVVTASYALVPLVQPGDVVVHYDSRQEAIVGVSMAASAAEPAPIYWVSRGSYARRAGEEARWLPGLRVALDQYQQLESPVTLAEIRRHKDALLTLRQRIQAAQQMGSPSTSRGSRTRTPFARFRATWSRCLSKLSACFPSSVWRSTRRALTHRESY
jgi:hypothetical protein